MRGAENEKPVDGKLEIELGLASEMAVDDDGVALELAAQRQHLGFDAQGRRHVRKIADHRLRAAVTIRGVAFEEM